MRGRLGSNHAQHFGASSWARAPRVAPPLPFGRMRAFVTLKFNLGGVWRLKRSRTTRPLLSPPQSSPTPPSSTFALFIVTHTVTASSAMSVCLIREGRGRQRGTDGWSLRLRCAQSERASPLPPGIRDVLLFAAWSTCDSDGRANEREGESRNRAGSMVGRSLFNFRHCKRTVEL